MRRSIICFLLLLEISCFAQDQIQMKNKTTFVGKIIAVDRAYVSFIPNNSIVDKKLIINTLSDVYVADSTLRPALCAASPPACTLFRKEPLFLVGDAQPSNTFGQDDVLSDARTKVNLRYNLEKSGRHFKTSGALALVGFGLGLIAGATETNYFLLRSGACFAISFGYLHSGGSALQQASKDF